MLNLRRGEEKQRMGDFDFIAPNSGGLVEVIGIYQSSDGNKKEEKIFYSDKSDN